MTSNSTQALNSARPDFSPKMRGLKDRDWLELLAKSVMEQRIDGVNFPGLPSRQLRAEFVGSADENALTEAFGSYVLIKDIEDARRFWQAVLLVQRV